jgi:hypothetical protein
MDDRRLLQHMGWSSGLWVTKLLMGALNGFGDGRCGEDQAKCAIHL